ncbi:MAG: flavin reductase family protein [Solirubrobacterales bacterium]|nr:flavin reductase family protein [Solirubrobacterales bacterium]
MAAPVHRGTFREVFGYFATGVAVVTAAGPTGTGGLTANAVSSLSLDPLLVLVCFDRTARTLPLVRETRRFAVNVLRSGQEELAARFASKIPEGEKLSGLNHHDVQGIPVLDDALAWAVCDLRELVPGGDHLIAIGEVTALHHDDGEPLVWFRGTYRELAD